MKTTTEQPASGVTVVQPARGYRYSADAFLLAGVALAEGPVQRAVDFGTGCGIVAFLLARRVPDVLGIEAQEEWATLWSASLAASRFRPRLQTLRVQDLVEGDFGLVTCNPPFSPAGSGPISPDPLKAAAHTELQGTLADFVRAARRAVADDGRVAFIVPRSREDELLGLYEAEGLGAYRLVRIGTKRVVVLGRVGASGTQVDELPARGREVDALYASVRSSID